MYQFPNATIFSLVLLIVSVAIPTSHADSNGLSDDLIPSGGSSSQIFARDLLYYRTPYAELGHLPLLRRVKTPTGPPYRDREQQLRAKTLQSRTVDAQARGLEDMARFSEGWVSKLKAQDLPLHEMDRLQDPNTLRRLQDGILSNKQETQNMIDILRVRGRYTERYRLEMALNRYKEAMENRVRSIEIFVRSGGKTASKQLKVHDRTPSVSDLRQPRRTF